MELRLHLQKNTKMKQVSISSTVLNRHLTLNCGDLGEVKRLNIQFVEQNMPFWSIGGKNLGLLCTELDNIISNLITKLELTEKHNIEVIYRGIIYKLDFRNSYHFGISALVDIYDMAVITNRHASNLYIFNKDLLKVYHGESIVAYLRAHNYLTKNQLCDGINQLWKDLKSGKIIEKDTLQEGLEHLITHGLVYLDKRSEEYSITATGYMFW